MQVFCTVAELAEIVRINAETEDGGDGRRGGGLTGVEAMAAT